MTGLTFGEVSVHEIEIPHEGAIVEGGAVRRRLSTPDQCAMGRPAEIGDMRPDIANRLAVKRSDRDANAVEHALEKFVTRLGGHGGCVRQRDKPCQTPRFGVFQRSWSMRAHAAILASMK